MISKYWMVCIVNIICIEFCLGAERIAGMDRIENEMEALGVCFSVVLA